MGTTQPKVKVIVRAPDQRTRKGGVPWGPLLSLVIVVGAVAGFFGWEQRMAAAIYPGVQIAGVDLGGLSMAEARVRLFPLRRAAMDRRIVVVAGDHRWTVTPAQLGLTLNLDQRLQEAYALGREADAIDRYSTQAELALRGRHLSLVGNYDTDTLRAFVQRVAIASYRSAQAAVVSLHDRHATLIADALNGQRLDQGAATALLAAALADPRQSLVSVPVVTVPAPVGEAEGRREVVALNAILGARLHLYFAHRHWLLGAGVIAPAIQLTTVVAPGGAATYQHSVDPRAIGRFVDDLAAQIDRPMRSAAVVARGSGVWVAPSQDGYHLDRAAAVQVLSQAILHGGEQDLALPVGITPPTTPILVAQATAKRVAALLRRPLPLTFGGRHWLLSSGQLAALLIFTPRRDPLVGPQLDYRVDPSRLPSVLGPEMAGVDVAPRNARFVVKGIHVGLLPATNGRQIDLGTLAPLIERRDRISAIPIPTRIVLPALTTANAQAMGITALYFQHSTSFPGSSAARLTNIHAAVQHLNGQLIAPGEIFSFNKRIGDITPQGGYVQGINIVDNQDVPGIGGGVCQVAVTLFQSAVFSGMPIVERIPHANIVGYYNPIGMDATIYVSPDGPDVKFVNNTGHWVLIDFVEDLPHYRLTARFFGTDPHYRVTVRGPFVKRQPNGDVDAVFYRTVTDASGKVLLDAHFNSHYVPVGSSG